MTKSHSDPLAAFRDAISGAGLPVPETVIPDGEIHRFSTNGKASNTDGWYVLHLDNMPAGAFGCWRTGVDEKWRDRNSKRMNAAERREYRQSIESIKKARAVEKTQRHAAAAKVAEKILADALPATDHAYLESKGVAAHSLRQSDNDLVLPVYNIAGDLRSLQFIDGDGNKKFLPGGEIAGGYFPIGNLGDVLYVTEGYATAASIHEATGAAVAVAFNAGNLKPVAVAFREKHPDLSMVIAADNDVRDDGSENTGIAKAEQAAAAVGARVAVPDLDGVKCDFNDVHQAHGLDVVREQLARQECPGDDRTVVSVDGGELLNDTREFIGRFCAFPDEHCLVAVTLWAAHSHAIQHFYSTPRLAIISAVLSSGKTRVLEILNLLVDSPMFAFNASPATVYRRLNERSITLLFDEVDTIWTSRGRDDDHSDLRALLNAGYKRGAMVPRCVGPKHEVVDFDVFCPVAMAGIGELPETIMSRSVIIKMRRRLPNERVEHYRDRIHHPQGHALRDRLSAWAVDVGEAAGEAYPDLPAVLVDRPAEVWEPLIAIADQAGGEWPDLAREAAVHLCKVAEDRRVTLGVRLLADLRTIFRDDDKLATATIIERLTVGADLDDDAPWADLRGKPIDSRKIAGLLRPFGIRSKNIQIGHQRLKGYTVEDLYESWQRYLPPTSETALQALHALQDSNGADSDVAEKNNVADAGATSEFAATPKPSNGKGSADVADVADCPPLEGACPHCDGEGCSWCKTDEATEVRL